MRTAGAMVACLAAGVAGAAPRVGPEVQLDTAPLIAGAPYTSSAAVAAMAVVAWNVSPTTAFTVRWALLGGDATVLKPGTGADAMGEFSRFGFAAASSPNGFLIAATDCTTAQWTGVTRISLDGGTGDGRRTRAGLASSREVSAAWTGSEWWLLERSSLVSLARVPAAGSFTPTSLQLPEIDAQLGRLGLASDGTTQWAVWPNRDGGISAAAYGTDAGLQRGPLLLQPGPGHTEPALAWGGGIFATVWTDAQDGGADIVGQLFRADGTGLAGGPIVLVGGPALQRWPSVAWDGTAFTVAWEESPAGPAWDVWALRLSAAGVPLEPPYRVAGSSESERRPSVAAIGPGELVVAYSYGDGGSSDQTPRARSLSWGATDAGSATDGGSDAGDVESGAPDAGDGGRGLEVDAGGGAPDPIEVQPRHYRIGCGCTQAGAGISSALVAAALGCVVYRRRRERPRR